MIKIQDIHNSLIINRVRRGVTSTFPKRRFEHPEASLRPSRSVTSASPFRHIIQFVANFQNSHSAALRTSAPFDGLGGGSDNRVNCSRYVFPFFIHYSPANI